MDTGLGVVDMNYADRMKTSTETDFDLKEHLGRMDLRTGQITEKEFLDFQLSGFDPYKDPLADYFGLTTTDGSGCYGQIPTRNKGEYFDLLRERENNHPVFGLRLVKFSFEKVGKDGLPLRNK